MVRQQYPHEENPLFEAIKKKDIEEFTRLLNSGVSVNTRNRHGETSLHAIMAEEESFCLSALAILIERNANLNVVNNNGDTPLHHGCMLGTTNTVKALLNYVDEEQRVSYLNAQNYRHETSLHTAVIAHDEEMVQLLLEFNPDLTIRDSDNLTSLQLCQDIFPTAETIINLLTEAEINQSHSPFSIGI
jgi:ankyrin repeat protein